MKNFLLITVLSLLVSSCVTTKKNVSKSEAKKDSTVKTEIVKTNSDKKDSTGSVVTNKTDTDKSDSTYTRVTVVEEWSDEFGDDSVSPITGKSDSFKVVNGPKRYRKTVTTETGTVKKQTDKKEEKKQDASVVSSGDSKKVTKSETHATDQSSNQEKDVARSSFMSHWWLILLIILAGWIFYRVLAGKPIFKQ